MIKVAMLSRWHVHADDYAKEAMENPNIEICVVWDEDAERGKSWANELGVPFEMDLEKVLSDYPIDGVIIDTPTNLHKEVIVKAITYKKHIFSEKVLALTTKDVDEILAAVEKNNIHLMLSLPRLNDDYYLFAQRMLDQGLLGKLTSVRCRVAHDGALPKEGQPHGWLPKHFFDMEQCGGGALIDLGAHPIYLTNRLAGPVASVSARLSHFFDYEVDDQSVVLVDYESGALGIIEAGFVSSGTFILELHGTEGVCMIENQSIRFKSIHTNNNEWTIPKVLPVNLPTAMEQWVDQIENGIAPTITKEDIWRLTQVNEMAIRSESEGRRVDV